MFLSAPIDSCPNADVAPFSQSLRRATLRMSYVYWPLVYIADSIMSSFTGIDFLEAAFYRVILYGFSALMTFGMAALLFRARALSFAQKAIVCFLLTAIAAPIFCVIDFINYTLCKYPEPVAFDPVYFGHTLMFGASIFFGWSCLFVALLYSFDVRDRERSLAASREEALSAQMRALRYQVSPYFLFNTLNSIAGLIEEGAETRAERMVLSLSTFLRTTLTLDPLNDVTLADELALQEEYLEIERERFSDRMIVSIEIPENVRGALVPSLILQPLIENAVKHGVGATTGKVEIVLSARRDADRLHLTVENGMPASGAYDTPPDSTGIGLKNVADRVRARFRDTGFFSSGPVGPGRYRASLDLPLRLA